jgi:penicillin-binding protein 1C
MPRLLKAALALFLLADLAFAFVLLMPFPKVLLELRPQETVKIFDRNGTLIDEEIKDAQGRQTFVPIADIPANLKNAFLAAEDQGFYEHSGVDFSAILRAVWQNVSAGQVVSGGSTITQQLVRNLIGVNKARSFSQKIKESVFALRLSRIHNKDQVFELYLNSIYFGGLAYGVEAASFQYFGKSSQNLDLAESAFLAGLPQAPNRYYPFRHFEAAKRRQETILSAMLKADLITQAEYDQSRIEDLKLKSSKVENKAPHFSDYVLQEVPENISTKIATTLDLGLQERVATLLESQITFLRSKNVENAAAVVLDAKTGDILAMVGGVNYFDSTIQGAVNLATSLRQPGSALKPLVYAAAFQKGWTPETVIVDEPIRYDTPEGLPYSPQNFDLGFRGPVTAAQALAQSLNVPAVKTLDYVGLSTFLKLARDFGITTFIEDASHYGLSLALGSGEVSLLELTSAYGTFANRGRHCAIRSVSTDSRPDCSLALKPETSALISSILSNNDLRMPEFGEENPLNFDYPVAAKTGTSRNFRDNWTVGYTDDYVVGVWVGNARGELMQGATGITGAAPIFSKIVNMLHERSGTKLTVDKSIQIATTLDSSTNEGANNYSRLQGDGGPNPQGFRIISPFANDLFLFDPSKPAESQKVQLKASDSAKWFVDDQPIGMGESVLWQIQRGEHTIRAVNGDTKREVAITVK